MVRKADFQAPPPLVETPIQTPPQAGAQSAPQRPQVWIGIDPQALAGMVQANPHDGPMPDGFRKEPSITVGEFRQRRERVATTPPAQAPRAPTAPQAAPGDRVTAPAHAQPAPSAPSAPEDTTSSGSLYTNANLQNVNTNIGRINEELDDIATNGSSLGNDAIGQNIQRAKIALHHARGSLEDFSRRFPGSNSIPWRGGSITQDGLRNYLNQRETEILRAEANPYSFRRNSDN